MSGTRERAWNTRERKHVQLYRNGVTSAFNTESEVDVACMANNCSAYPARVCGPIGAHLPGTTRDFDDMALLMHRFQCVGWDTPVCTCTQHAGTKTRGKGWGICGHSTEFLLSNPGNV